MIAISSLWSADYISIKGVKKPFGQRLFSEAQYCSLSGFFLKKLSKRVQYYRLFVSKVSRYS